MLKWQKEKIEAHADLGSGKQNIDRIPDFTIP